MLQLRVCLFSLEQSALEGIRNSLSLAMKIEFDENILDMIANREMANAQVFSQNFRGQTLGQQGEHLDFSAGKI